MDTKKECKLPKYGVLPKIDKNKVVVGAKQLRKAMEKGIVQYVCFAKNADPGITEPLAEQCKTRGISCIWVSSMRELGVACGIEVGAAAAAVIDKSGSTGESRGI